MTRNVAPFPQLSSWPLGPILQTQALELTLLSTVSDLEIEGFIFLSKIKLKEQMTPFLKTFVLTEECQKNEGVEFCNS